MRSSRDRQCGPFRQSLSTLLKIAFDADVGPALAHHYYGSKEKLLDAATTLPSSFLERIVIAWQAPPGQLGEQLVRQMLRDWQDPDHEPVLRAVMQIAGNEPATREKLRHIIERSMMGPVGPDPDGGRAAAAQQPDRVTADGPALHALRLEDRAARQGER
jgi:AcrR family transcriptional regulator